jgi:branched-chain amino acid transport system permease protein
MNTLFNEFIVLTDFVLLNCGLALSQYVVLRAGVFSLATAGLAACGAYAAAILTQNYGVSPPLAIVVGTLAGTLMALILSVPLARLRGVYQAIATLAFVQITLSVILWATPVTGGATGINGLPKFATTPVLIVLVGLMIYILAMIGRSVIGRAFDTIRQDETVAVALGIPVSRYHALAFALSGAIAGLTGALIAYHNYSVTPEEFGFATLTAVLSYVVLGGRQSIGGPLVGAALLTILPELARPLAGNRMVLTGILLVAVIIYLPHGIVDTLLGYLRARRQRAAQRPPELSLDQGPLSRDVA